MAVFPMVKGGVGGESKSQLFPIASYPNSPQSTGYYSDFTLDFEPDCAVLICPISSTNIVWAVYEKNGKSMSAQLNGSTPYIFTDASKAPKINGKVVSFYLLTSGMVGKQAWIYAMKE